MNFKIDSFKIRKNSLFLGTLKFKKFELSIYGFTDNPPICVNTPNLFTSQTVRRALEDPLENGPLASCLLRPLKVTGTDADRLGTPLPTPITV